MSLTDLKKGSAGKSNKKRFTIDEFISDAENYAKGTPEIVSSEIATGTQASQELNLVQAVAAAKKHQKDKENQASGSTKPFRHSTFTLSEEAIEQLQALAQKTKLAKSHIIRILIDELCNSSQQEQLKKLFDSNVI